MNFELQISLIYSKKQSHVKHWINQWC